MAKLLIVDDELDVKEYAANFFRRRNVDVATASSGEEALKVIKKDTPKLVLLDIKLGGIDGIETLGRIKEADQAIKVIMVTGKEPKEDEALERCLKLGALNYIHKPLKLEELEKVVLEELSKDN